MEINLARHLIRTSFRCARELENTLLLLKEHCAPDEYKGHALRIAAAIDAINTSLMHPPLKAHPELTDEVEASLARYDRFL